MTLKGKGVPGLAWKSAAFSGKLPDVLVIDVTIEDEAGELFWATSQPCAMSEEHDGADWMERRDGERSLIGSIGDAVRGLSMRLVVMVHPGAGGEEGSILKDRNTRNITSSREYTHLFVSSKMGHQLNEGVPGVSSGRSSNLH